MAGMKERLITQQDEAKRDEDLKQAFETFLKREEGKELTEADLTEDDFECACAMCSQWGS